MLLELYQDEIKNYLMQRFSYKNIMEIPKIKKISVNIGLGIVDRATLENVANNVALISGQKPVIVKARKSIANFKLREGMPIGVKVTLRRLRMYHFLERLLYIALPRSRDFKGLKKSGLDGNGNYSFGIKEHIIFPEIGYSSGKIYGMDVSIITTAKNNEECLELLAKIGFPFIDR